MPMASAAPERGLPQGKTGSIRKECESLAAGCQEASYRIAYTGFPMLASTRRVPLATHGSGWDEDGPQGSRGLPAARPGAASPAYRYHHGRKRTLGPATAHAARSRTS